MLLDLNKAVKIRNVKYDCFCLFKMLLLSLRRYGINTYNNFSV